jgi:uncharacterized protein (DUF302 family)
MNRIALIAVLLGWWAAQPTWAQSIVRFEAKGSFDDVKQLLIVAIENQGFVVDHLSKVGEMLERTGRDLGATRRIYERAEVLEFCSAKYSRELMEADPGLLAFCPFGIGIFTLPGETDTVHLVYRRMQADGVGPQVAQTLQQVDRILRTIAEEAIE